MGYYIGMDVGGTYARIKIADAAGHVLHAAEGDGGTISAAGYEEMHSRFLRLVQPALDHCGLKPQDCAGLCLGASGIDSPELHAQYVQILTDIGFPDGVIRALNDCELLLSLFQGPCVVLIAGTGSIAMGKAAPDQPVCRCGGWSYILSDEGSAPAISFAAMRAMLKHWDGQLSCPILVELFQEHFGLDTPQALVSWCHQNLHRKELLARIAPLVEQAARSGDPCALQIMKDTAQQLFALAANAAGKINPPQGQFSLLMWGSVLIRNGMIRTEVCRLLRAAYPRATAYTLRTSALDCALALAMNTLPEGQLTPLCQEAS